MERTVGARPDPGPYAPADRRAASKLEFDTVLDWLAAAAAFEWRARLGDSSFVRLAGGWAAANIGVLALGSHARDLALALRRLLFGGG